MNEGPPLQMSGWQPSSDVEAPDGLVRITVRRAYTEPTVAVDMDVSIALDPASGRLSQATLAPAADEACVP